MTDDHTMLVASTGGHLTQLITLAHRIRDLGDVTWVTFDGPQSRSLLAGHAVEFVPYMEPRGYRALLKNLPLARRILRSHRPTRVVSTGSGIALAFLPFARYVGAEAHYIESATRVRGPSRTGELLQRSKRVHLHTQHPQWADDRWSYRGSVFDGFEYETGPERSIERVVVTLGTMETYGFRRLVERLAAVLPPDAEVTWQVGATDVTGLGLDADVELPAEQLHAAIRSADLVVAHAGTGTALSCLELGRRPLLVPRTAAHGEHVDDHQHQTAEYLAARGLVATTTVEAITLDRLVDATQGSILQVDDPEQIDLS